MYINIIKQTSKLGNNFKIIFPQIFCTLKINLTIGAPTPKIYL